MMNNIQLWSYQELTSLENIWEETCSEVLRKLFSESQAMDSKRILSSDQLAYADRIRFGVSQLGLSDSLLLRVGLRCLEYALDEACIPATMRDRVREFQELARKACDERLDQSREQSLRDAVEDINSSSFTSDIWNNISDVKLLLGAFVARGPHHRIKGRVYFDRKFATTSVYEWTPELTVHFKLGRTVFEDACRRYGLTLSGNTEFSRNIRVRAFAAYSAYYAYMYTDCSNQAYYSKEEILEASGRFATSRVSNFLSSEVLNSLKKGSRPFKVLSTIHHEIVQSYRNRHPEALQEAQKHSVTLFADEAFR